MIREIGTQIQLSNVARDLSGNLVNTPTLTLTVTKPDGTTAAPTVTNTGANGLYTAQVTPDQAGLWLYKWTASGAVIAVQSDQFTVVASQRALVASLEEFKQHLNRTDIADDLELRTFLVAATDWVEDVIRGPLVVTSFTELVRLRRGRLFPRYRPLVSVTSVTPELGAVIDSSTYVVDTRLNMIRMLYGYGYGHGRGYSHGDYWYSVVYRAGLATITERAKLAGLIVAAHNWQTQNGGGGLPIPGDPGVGANADMFFSQGMGFAIPNRARDLLRTSIPVLVN